LKAKINTILPIALALILPGLSLYTHMGLEPKGGIGFFSSWLISSVILYVLWYLLWYLWDISSRYRGLLIALALFAFTAIIYVILYLIVFGGSEDFNGTSMLRVLLASILFMAIQYALRTQQNYSRLLLEKEQLQTENYKTQLKALRAQIDPHFLFNSLNTLRSMVRQQHANSEKFVMSLADFYRQTLKHNENTTLRLSEELVVLQSYLFLMKSRNEEAVSVNLQIDDDLLQFHLPALALQVVVENCFKHNSMTARMPLNIEIKNTDDYYIEVVNNVQPKIGDQDSTGFGLDSLRKRYELMNIPNGMIVHETPDQFSVKLKLI
jgi:two-component system LytT family sensor kinase